MAKTRLTKTREAIEFISVIRVKFGSNLGQIRGKFGVIRPRSSQGHQKGRPTLNSMRPLGRAQMRQLLLQITHHLAQGHFAGLGRTAVLVFDLTFF